MDRTWRSKSVTSKKLFQTITKNSITRESFQNSPITAATTSVASNVRSLKTANDFVTAFKTLNSNFANMALQDQESLHEQVKSAVLSLRNQIRIQKESFVIDAKLASVFDEVVRLYGKMAVSQKGTVSLHTRKNSIQESNEDISYYQRSETVTPNKRASVGSLSSLSRSGSTSNDKTFLKNIYSTFKKSQKNPSSAVDLRKKSMENSPTQLGVNQKSLYINMLRYFADLTYQLMKIEGLGVEIIIQTNNYLNMVLICLDLEGKMFVNAIFSILITLIGYAGGHKLVYNAFISLQNQRNETTSFKSLEYHLRLSIMRSDLEVIPKVVKFCNIFVNGSQNLEQKIYLQYIFKQNGITENIRSLLSREETTIRRAARSYVNNIIDVEKFQTIMFENANLKEKLAKAASRATHAEKDKTEIDRGQLKKISDLERENIKIKIFL
ncbi:MAG: Formin-like protein 1 [Paramarteilia canceri]